MLTWCLIFLFFALFSSDHSDDTTPLSSSGPLEHLDVKYSEVSHPGHEFSVEGHEFSVEAISAAPEHTSPLESIDMDVTSDFNSTSDPAVPSPRASHGSFSQDTKEKMPVFSMSGSQVVPSAGGSGAAPPSPWYGPPFYHEHVYAGAGAHPYSYESGTVGFPHHIYAGSPPYGYSYGTPLSPNYNAYSSGGSSPLSYGAPGYPSVSHGTTRTTSSYGFLAQQPPMINPEFFLLGDILMRVRQVPLAQAWRASEVPGVIENLFSHVVQSNRGYPHARDLPSNNQYSENPSDHSPEPEMQGKGQTVPVMDL